MKRKLVRLCLFRLQTLIIVDNESPHRFTADGDQCL